MGRKDEEATVVFKLDWWLYYKPIYVCALKCEGRARLPKNVYSLMAFHGFSSIECMTLIGQF